MNRKKLLSLILTICLCFIPVVYAAEDDIIVSAIKNVSISDGVVSTSSDAVNLKFNDLDQTAKYEVTLKNNTKKDVYINELEVEGASKSFVKYRLASVGDVIKANSSAKTTIVLSAQNEKGAGENFSDDISFKLSLNESIANPNTNRNRLISLIILIVVGAVAITFITLKFNSRKGPLTVAIVFFMLLGISWTYADDTTVVNFNGKVTYTSQNLLESSGTIISNAKADYTKSKDIWAYHDKVKNIIISHELNENETATKLDLTIDDKQRVSGYLVPNASDNAYYDLYIVANGVIYAPEDATGLFSFPNVETITGLENVRFDKTTKMTGMFIGNEKLKSMDMSILKTDNVTDTSYMFHKCLSLDLSNVEFNLDNVENKTNMFVQYLYDVVKKDAVSDVNTDFSAEPVTGKYIVNSTINDKYPVYYYRGAIEDNNVRFANFCWKMVRTTETGGIKLIYNGVPESDGSCNNTGEASQIGTSAFNSTHTSPAYVGYMYGTAYEATSKTLTEQTDIYLYGNDVSWDGTNYTLTGDTKESSSWATDYKTLAKYHYTCFNDTGICKNVYYINYFGKASKAYYLTLKDGKNIENAKEEMFTNTNNSIIKNVVDNWYASNMTGYTNMLEDTVWCNNRTITSGPLYSKDVNSTGISYFGAYLRNISSIGPLLTCSNKLDSFTVDGTNGNGALTYPVGLLTADEYTLAGSGNKGYSTTSYLHTGQYQWTLSPFGFSYYYAGGFGIGLSGYLGSIIVADSHGVRPSVSLKLRTPISGGDGSVLTPYIVE